MTPTFLFVILLIYTTYAEAKYAPKTSSKQHASQHTFRDRMSEAVFVHDFATVYSLVEYVNDEKVKKVAL